MSLINCFWKQNDIVFADSLIKELDVDDSDVINIVGEHLIYNDDKLENIDLIYCVYELALQKATNILYSTIHIYLDYYISIHNNSINTKYHIIDSDYDELYNILKANKDIINWNDKNLIFVLKNIGMYNNIIKG